VSSSVFSRREILTLPLVALAGCASVKKAVVRPGPYVEEGVHHVGNSTHLIVLDGKTILTDPWIKDPADEILKHRVPADLLPSEPDVVLITHAHEDHFDELALALIHNKAIAVVPSWMVERTKAFSFAQVIGMKSGDVVDVAGFRIEAANALHDIDEIVYRIERSGRSIFFGGDTLPTKEIELLPSVDFAILPADAGALMGKRYVMNVEEAIAMAERFKAKGAMLSHHECALTSPLWAAIVDVKPVDITKLPAWFKAPVPGQHISYPWS
jgi:L-ascorbate metabolism protein UlaG (beta-lactamase superfamily)